jgi:4-hydroxybenzoate polyprenyltransferase
MNLLYLLLSVSFLIAGYNSFNAITDKYIDKINKPHRPLAKGAITEGEALYATIAFFVISLIASYLINTNALIIDVMAVILAILYSLPKVNLKKILGVGTLTANILYTVLFPLVGWAASSSQILPIGLIIYLFFFGIGIATLKDFEDVIGDNWHGSHSLLSFFGYSKTVAFVLLTILFDTIILLLPQTSVLGPKYIVLSLFAIPLIINLRSLHSKRHVKQGKRAFLYGISIMMVMEIALIILSITIL